MNEELEKLTDELTNRAKSGRDLSKWSADHRFSALTHLLLKLTSFRKVAFPQPDFDLIKNKVLDRISIPQDIKAEAKAWGISLPFLFKFLAGGLGAMLILISLSIGTAVAALQSSPGETIYPLKKIVENVELTLTRDPNQRADLQIQFANDRLDELSEVIAKNKAGEISSEEAQKIVAQTVTDLQKTTQAASQNTKSQPKVSTLNKLVDLSNKQAAVLQPLISAASVNNDGEVKIVLEQALQTSTITKEQAIQNIENAGLQVEDQPITIPTDTATSIVTASGKITALTQDSVSIGTSKFLLTNDTKYVNILSTDLKIDLTVDISGEVRDDGKTYAVTITGPLATLTPTSSSNSSSTSTTSPGQ